MRIEMLIAIGNAVHNVPGASAFGFVLQDFSMHDQLQDSDPLMDYRQNAGQFRPN